MKPRSTIYGLVPRQPNVPVRRLVRACKACGQPDIVIYRYEPWEVHPALLPLHYGAWAVGGFHRCPWTNLGMKA